MESEKSIFDLNVDMQGKAHLREAAKWARFLAISGFIGLSLMVILSVVSLVIFKTSGVNQADPEFDSWYLAGTFVGALMIAALYFFPCLFLLRFAGKMKAALNANDVTSLNESFRNLKKTLRYLGVVTIILLVLLLAGILSDL